MNIRKREKEEEEKIKQSYDLGLLDYEIWLAIVMTMTIPNDDDSYPQKQLTASRDPNF